MANSSLTERIDLVRERLEFVHIVTDLNPQFLDPTKTKPTSDGGWTHPWIHFDALRNYLLLTCFDLLGQPSEWKDFSSWLNSKKLQTEVNAVIEKHRGHTDVRTTIEAVHRAYQERYGVTNSFYRFINDVIPQETREALLYSISISYSREFHTYDEQGHVIGTGAELVRKIEDDTSKLKFLFDLRNSYTHRAVNIGSPGGGVWPQSMLTRVENGKVLHGWSRLIVKREKESDCFYDYGVRNWPEVLIQVVEAGITQLTSRP